MTEENTPQEQPVQPEQQPTQITNDDKNMAVLGHLLGLLFGFIPSLIIWLVNKDKNQYVEGQAKEALNFQITLTIGFFVAWITSFLFIGALLFPVLWVMEVVFCIMGAVASSKGEYYRYPVSIRLIS